MQVQEQTSTRFGEKAIPCKFDANVTKKSNVEMKMTEMDANKTDRK